MPSKGLLLLACAGVIITAQFFECSSFACFLIFLFINFFFFFFFLINFLQWMQGYTYMDAMDVRIHLFFAHVWIIVQFLHDAASSRFVPKKHSEWCLLYSSANKHVFSALVE